MATSSWEWARRLALSRSARLSSSSAGGFGGGVGREAAISMARGLVQMVFVGMVLAVLLHGNLLVGVLILLAMTFAAAVTASRRSQDIKGSLLLCFYAIAAGSG